MREKERELEGAHQVLAYIELKTILQKTLFKSSLTCDKFKFKRAPVICPKDIQKEREARVVRGPPKRDRADLTAPQCPTSFIGAAAGKRIQALKG